MSQRIIVIMAFFTAISSGAGILFDPEHAAIWIRDYPPDCPCSLRQLAVADRAFGWGKVRYDEATATCRIDGDLLIGDNDDTETVLQIGTPDCLRETLIMRGNIFIHPYFVHGENGEHYWRTASRMNALRIGMSGAADMTATLRFACSSNEYYTIYCSHLPWITNGVHGGGLYVYHGEISALNPAHPIGDRERGWMHCCGSGVFDGARIADVKGFIYGLTLGPNKDYLIRNTLFERIGAPLLNGAQRAAGCVFRHCGTAVKDYGGLNAELTDCRFENNDHNWELTMTPDGLTLVDCAWDAPRKGDLFSARVLQGKTTCPQLSVQRHVVVEVADGAGRPVEGAAVSFRAEQDGCDLIQGRVVKTDSQGRTPGAGSPGAILLIEYIQTAVPDATQPAMRAFTYAITAEHQGWRAVLPDVRPDVNWKIIKLKLEK